jgi:hypothetical protein
MISAFAPAHPILLPDAAQRLMDVTRGALSGSPCISSARLTSSALSHA